MPLYLIEKSGFQEIPRTTFEKELVMERDGLQRYFKENIGLLGGVIGEELFLLSDEFSGWEDSSRRIDLLCLNKDLGLTVIEIKRTEDGGHMELQALRYAAMVSPMTAKQAAEAYKKMLARDCRDEAAAEDHIAEFVGEPEGERFELTGSVNIVLVSANFSKEVTGTVLWLNDKHGMNIRCVRLTPYKHEGKIIVDMEQMIPLPEAAEYLVKMSAQRDSNMREKLEAQDAKRELHTRFWSGFLDYCKQQNELALFKAKKTTYKSYYPSEAFGGKAGVSLSCKVL